MLLAAAAPAPLSTDAAEALVAAAGVYLGLGLAFALAFALVGAARVDPDARGASWGFRVLLLPGATLLWPLLARRWLTGSPPPEERTPHKRSAREAGEAR